MTASRLPEHMAIVAPAQAFAEAGGPDSTATATAGGARDEPHRKFDSRDAPAEPENGTSPVFQPLDGLKPAPENCRLYCPVEPSDPAVQALAASIREYGVLEPLVVSEDGYILSGHRRYTAAKIAGLEVVPCRVEPIRRDTDRDAFLRRLREYNRQREKTRSERLREEIVSADPEAAYRSLIDYRREQSRVGVSESRRIALAERKQRARISESKVPMLEAAQDAIDAYAEFWPLSVRQIFYLLLRNPPLRHAKKPGSVFRNDRASYQDLSNLLVRARLCEYIAEGAIHDETRPVSAWRCFDGTGSFLQAEMEDFLKGYWRDLLQSQENHFEILAEKLTVKTIVGQVAMQYCIPLTIGRGYSSLPARAGLVERYKRSGKGLLILVMVSDFDPDGEEIAHSFARSLRDDFGVVERHIVPVKAALTGAQVEGFHLPRNMDAKASSANYRKFVERHGTAAYELEALAPEDLQAALRETIDGLLDVHAFNAELDAERKDAVFLQGVRTAVREVLSDLEL
ncbi:MAG: ParB N-terminal domain-containing protein [Planctomycetes bacterium]|nr:ParB N-terminal domain-containing protein [Planctomycetota bacterium]